MSNTKILHHLWWQVSKDERNIEIHSVIQLALLGYPIMLSERTMTLPCRYEKAGKWLTKYNGNGWNDYWDYTCPECGREYKRADNVLYNARYCPNCGARMKGADDETD